VCRGENVYNMGERSYHRTCCRRIQETVTDSAREVIDLTADTDDERESDHIPIHEGEKNVAEVSINEITGNFKIITKRVFCSILLKSLA